MARSTKKPSAKTPDHELHELQRIARISKNPNLKPPSSDIEGSAHALAERLNALEAAVRAVAQEFHVTPDDVMREIRQRIGQAR